MGRVICACKFWGLWLPLDNHGLKRLPEAEHLCCLITAATQYGRSSFI